MNRGLQVAALVLAILSALLFLLGEGFGHASLAGAVGCYVASTL